MTVSRKNGLVDVTGLAEITPRLSASGKQFTYVTTGGQTTVVIDGEPFELSVNLTQTNPFYVKGMDLELVKGMTPTEQSACLQMREEHTEKYLARRKAARGERQRA